MNYYSKQVSVTGAAQAIVIGTDVPMREVSGLQNNTGGVVTIKLNGGDGTFRLPDGAYFEPFKPIQGEFTISSTADGTCCVLG